MATTRNGDDLHLIYDLANWPTDHMDYYGTIDNDQFAAASNPWNLGSLPWAACGGAGATLVAKVAGRFSPDMKTLTAKDQWIYQFSSGSVVTVFADWTGQAR